MTEYTATFWDKLSRQHNVTIVFAGTDCAVAKTAQLSLI